MPAGIPVATVSIDGAKNAGLLAVRILGASDAALADRVEAYAADLESQVEEKNAGSRSPCERRAPAAVAAPRVAATPRRRRGPPAALSRHVLARR